MDYKQYLPIIALGGIGFAIYTHLKNQEMVDAASPSPSPISYRQPTIASLAPLPSQNDGVLSQERVQRAQIASEAFNNLLQFRATEEGYDVQKYLTKKQTQLGTRQSNNQLQASVAQSNAAVSVAQAQAQAQAEAAKAMYAAQNRNSLLSTLTSSLGSLLAFF